MHAGLGTKYKKINLGGRVKCARGPGVLGEPRNKVSYCIMASFGIM